MTLKILKVFGKLETKMGIGIPGDTNCYPEGTERDVIKYFLFPKKLEGIKKRGLQIVRQIARDKISSNDESSFHYNHWKDLRFIEY